MSLVFGGLVYLYTWAFLYICTSRDLWVFIRSFIYRFLLLLFISHQIIVYFSFMFCIFFNYFTVHKQSLSTTSFKLLLYLHFLNNPHITPVCINALNHSIGTFLNWWSVYLVVMGLGGLAGILEYFTIGVSKLFVRVGSHITFVSLCGLLYFILLSWGKVFLLLVCLLNC